MVHRIKVGKRVLVAPAAGLLVLVALTLTGTTAVRADTHSGQCVSVDQFGNVTVLQDSCSQQIPVTTTEQVMPGTLNPCSADNAYGTLVTYYDHATAHVTVNSKGDAWLTETDGGSATFTPDNPSDASGHGTWTSWGGTELNNKSTVMGMTYTIRLSMSDGTHVTEHLNSHETITPNGITADFFTVTPSCG